MTTDNDMEEFNVEMTSFLVAVRGVRGKIRQAKAGKYYCRCHGIRVISAPS